MAAFINSERKWDDAIARFQGEVIDQAFPNADLPATISYSSFGIPACGAILYEVGADFELAEGLASLSFIFNTGDGGLRSIDAPVPPPSISNIHLTYEDEEGEEHRWDADTNTWPPAMPAT